MTQDATITRINPALALQKPLEDYIQYLEKMTSRSVRLLEKMAVPGMRYSDTEHEVRGTDAITEIFSKRFTETQSLKFRVDDRAWGHRNQTAYLRWTMICVRHGVEDTTQGIAEVMFSNDGLVMSHTDYVGVLSRVAPVRSSFIDKLKKSLKKS